MKNNGYVNENGKENLILPLTVRNVILMLFFAIIAIGCIAPIPKRLKDYELEKQSNYVLEEATIVEYKEYVENLYTYYNVYYEYIDSDGYKYTGLWQARLKTEEEAKSMVGQKVPIYVDNELKIHSKKLGKNTSINSIWVYGVLGVGCILGFLITVVNELYLILQWQKCKLEHQNETKENTK